MKKLTIHILLAVGTVLVLAACGDTPGPGSPGAGGQMETPQGRILTVNQDANTVSVIDVATDRAYASLPTGAQPHHVVATPDGKEFWITLYGEDRLQVFDSKTLKEVASVDVGGPNDDLVFDPAGKRLYVSLGQKNEVVVIDVAARSVVERIPVGKTPHGLKVTPDGKFLLVTNTADNTLSVVSLGEEVVVAGTIKTGANPFEVTTSEDSGTAYVSNFLGDSISVVDLATRKTVGYIKSGKKPAMLAFEEGSGGGQDKLWVANTGSDELWVIDANTRKLITRIPVGKGAHGALGTPSGKLYVTNSEDGTVSVVDQAQAKVVRTIPVGKYPNGLTYLPESDSQ